MISIIQSAGSRVVVGYNYFGAACARSVLVLRTPVENPLLSLQIDRGPCEYF